MNTLAIDIGATKIALALCDGSFNLTHRKQISSQHEPTVESDPNDSLWESLKRELISYTDQPINHIGVASAGPIDCVTGTVSPVNITQWRDFPLIERISQIFPDIPISMLGDCSALALAEHTIGAAKDHKNVLGVVVSTGIGGGLVINGKVHLGRSGNAAMIGHHSIAFTSDRICVCGRTGCLEEFTRGPKMVEAAKKEGWIGGDDFQSLATSARAGDQIALAAIDAGIAALAVGITNALMIADVNTVVIGGGVSFAGDIFWSPLRKHLKREAALAGYLDELNILAANLGADAGLLGAAIHARTAIYPT